ncbi:MAG: phosphatase [Planctomycetota bacterium]|nr:MAG: phosphatase [Planctomycetota bacterium]
MNDRRQFIKMSAAISLAFAGRGLLADSQISDLSKSGYGALVKDSKGILDLPKGFSYKVVSKMGDKMTDGFLVPSRPDGMAAFQEKDLTIIMRNHESNFHWDGPYGAHRKLFPKMDKSKVYDICNDGDPCTGGVSKIVYDTKKQVVISQSVALTGTVANCAGGATPWGSWITCEETLRKTNDVAWKKRRYSKDHGYNFEVKANSKLEICEPIPLKAMGRFRHEAVGVDPKTGIVYQSEDRGNGLLYRFLPNEKGNLVKGGKLQALVFEKQAKFVTNNWDAKYGLMTPGVKYKTRWIDLNNVESPGDTLRKQGRSKGASAFCRGEGIFFGNNELYLACTAGGAKKLGQIFKYIPAVDEAKGSKSEKGGTIELHYESQSERDMRFCDNITVSPWGDIIACEDFGGDDVRLIGLTPKGNPYTFASHHLKNEFTGATFSPDGTTLFVNVQSPGLTFAISGPWKK